MDLKLLESELLKLSPSEKAQITYTLLKSLEGEKSSDFEEIWVDEALSRYKDINKKNESLIDSDLVIKEAKSKYK